MEEDKHHWSWYHGFDTSQYKPKNWDKCDWCGAKRMRDHQEGWPSWYVYFTKDGDHGQQDGRIPPKCSGDPQLTLPGIV